MKRYYIAQFDSVTVDDGISRPVLPWDGLGVPSRWIALPDGNGRYGKNWVFAIVGGDQHDVIQQNTKAFVLPDGGLDITFGTLKTAQRNVILNKLQQLGIDTAGINVNTTIGEILELAAKQIKPNFSILGFDVQDQV